MTLPHDVCADLEKQEPPTHIHINTRQASAMGVDIEIANRLSDVLPNHINPEEPESLPVDSTSVPTHPEAASSNDPGPQTSP